MYETYMSRVWNAHETRMKRGVKRIVRLNMKRPWNVYETVRNGNHVWETVWNAHEARVNRIWNAYEAMHEIVRTSGMKREVWNAYVSYYVS